MFQRFQDLQFSGFQSFRVFRLWLFVTNSAPQAPLSKVTLLIEAKLPSARIQKTGSQIGFVGVINDDFQWWAIQLTILPSQQPHGAKPYCSFWGVSGQPHWGKPWTSSVPRHQPVITSGGRTTYGTEIPRRQLFHPPPAIEERPVDLVVVDQMFGEQCKTKFVSKTTRGPPPLFRLACRRHLRYPVGGFLTFPKPSRLP